MVAQLTRSAVRIYASLSALSNDSGSILDGLLPFFDPILRRHNGKKLDPDAIASEVRDMWKWNFNSDLVEAFVPHFLKQGWIAADIPSPTNTSYTINIADDSEVADSTIQTVELELRRIAVQFKDFSETISPLTAIPRDVEEFETILVEWLIYVEAFSEKSIDFQIIIRQDPFGRLGQFIDIPRTTSLKDDEIFLCARFVKHAIENDTTTSEILARIAAIGLLTEVVQDFVKPVNSIDSTDLIVYLDAPVAMELLGLSGKSARENTAPVVSELIRIGASVRIFGQSIDEIKNSLRAVLKNPRPTGPTAQAMLRREVLREYVVQASTDPTPLLEKIGVNVAYRTLEQTPSEHQYFTRENWQELYAKLGYADNPAAREHDADITAFVVRQRRDRVSRDIFKSRAIILTRNGLLAQIVRRFGIETLSAPDMMVPPVVHRRVFATAMWLRTGMGASDLNVPKRMLLANCERVLAIRPGVVDAVKRLTDALGDEDKTRQLDLLISQDRSTQVLMDKTLGQSNVVTEGNLAVLWQEMLHPYLEEERMKRLKAVNDEKKKATRKLNQINEEFQTLRKDRDQKIASLGEQLEARRREDRCAVEALCDDVGAHLRKARRNRMVVASILGLCSSAPLLMNTTPLVKLTAFVIGSLFAYLTLTGGKVFGLGISEERAINTLRTFADRRNLKGKLDQFTVSWAANKFTVGDRESARTLIVDGTNLLSDDLFASIEHDKLDRARTTDGDHSIS